MQVGTGKKRGRRRISFRWLHGVKKLHVPRLEQMSNAKAKCMEKEKDIFSID